jgi:hypothetical protein
MLGNFISLAEDFAPIEATSNTKDNTDINTCSRAATLDASSNDASHQNRRIKF